MTASAVMMGAYKKELAKRGLELDYENPNQEAIVEATKVFRRTQASGFFKDVPLAISRGAFTGNKSFDKALFQFKTFMLGRWGQIRHQMWTAGFKGGNPKQGAEVALYLTMATMTEAGIRSSNKVLIAMAAGGLAAAMSELDKELEQLPKDVIFEAATSIPFMGDFLRGVMYAQYGMDVQAIPSFSVLSDVMGGTSEALFRKKGTSKVRGAVKAIGGTTAALGIPGTAQATQLLREALKDRRL